MTSLAHTLATSSKKVVMVCNCVTEDSDTAAEIKTIKELTRRAATTRSNRVIDLIFVLDASSSVGRHNLLKSLEFAENVLDQFTVAPGYTTPALVTFGASANLDIALDHYGDKCKFMTRLNSMKYRLYRGGSGKNVQQGVAVAYRELKQRQRQNSLKIIIILSTDSRFPRLQPLTSSDPLQKLFITIRSTMNAYIVDVLVRSNSAMYVSLGPSQTSTGNQMMYSLHFFPTFGVFANMFSKGGQQDLFVSATKDKCGYRCSGTSTCGCNAKGGRSYTCACSAGSRLSGYSCVACPVGQYTDAISSASSCKRCPQLTSTRGPGANSIGDCLCVTGYMNIHASYGSTDRKPPCKAVKCRPLKPKRFSSFKGVSSCGYSYNTRCEFGCSKGYEIARGHAGILVCQDNGLWNYQEPTCRAVTCPQLSQAQGANTWHCKHPDGLQDNQMGSVCQTTCKLGSIPKGDSRRVCQANRAWSGTNLRCEAVRCSGLPNPKYGQYVPSTCKNGANANNGTCELKCNAGYQVVGKKYRFCLANQTWSGQGELHECKDVQKPNIVNCPASIEKDNDENTNGAEINLDDFKATVTDNSNENINFNIITTAKLLDGNTFFFPISSSGTSVEYQFTDTSGNKASCKFKVIVKDVEPPTAAFCPRPKDIITKQLNTFVKWDEPVFEDNSGKISNIVSNLKPGPYRWGTYSVVYDAYDPSSNQGKCEFPFTVKPHSCTPLPAPINGAVTCNTAIFGSFCTISCQKPLDFKVPEGKKVPSMYVCGGSGRWSPHDIVPDCTAKRNADAHIAMEFNYHDNECPDSTSQQKIKEDSVQLFRSSVFGMACGCTIEADDYEVTCGAIKPSVGSRVRRATEYMVDIKIGILGNNLKAEDPKIMLGKLKNTYQLNKQKLVSKVLKGKRNVSLAVVESGVTCQSGEELINSTDGDKCYACPKGYYFLNATRKCLRCPVGMYSEKARQLQCTPCPVGMTTVSDGAFAAANCSAKCQPGTYSPNGLQKPYSCSACPVDTYTDDVGSTVCKQCPPNTRTSLIGGATSMKNCRATCMPGFWSPTGLEKCRPCARNSYQDKPFETECKACPSGHITRAIGSTSSQDCIDRECPPLFTLFPKTKTCLSISSGEKSFIEANQACARMGGFLVMLKTKVEYKSLTKSLKSDKAYWIGLTRIANNSFIWSDGSKMSFNELGSLPLNQTAADNCVAMSGPLAFSWLPQLCLSTHHYICQATTVPVY